MGFVSWPRVVNLFPSLMHMVAYGPLHDNHNQTSLRPLQTPIKHCTAKTQKGKHNEKHKPHWVQTKDKQKQINKDKGLNKLQKHKQKTPSKSALHPAIQGLERQDSFKTVLIPATPKYRGFHLWHVNKLEALINHQLGIYMLHCFCVVGDICLPTTFTFPNWVCSGLSLVHVHSSSLEHCH